MDIAQGDHVSDARQRLGCAFTETVFYRCALEQGYGRKAEDRARELFTIYARGGWNELPQATKKFILDVCNGAKNASVVLPKEVIN